MIAPTLEQVRAALGDGDLATWGRLRVFRDLAVWALKQVPCRNPGDPCGYRWGDHAPECPASQARSFLAALTPAPADCPPSLPTPKPGGGKAKEEGR